MYSKRIRVTHNVMTVGLMVMNYLSILPGITTTIQFLIDQNSIANMDYRTSISIIKHINTLTFEDIVVNHQSHEIMNNLGNLLNTYLVMTTKAVTFNKNLFYTKYTTALTQAYIIDYFYLACNSGN